MGAREVGDEDDLARVLVGLQLAQAEGLELVGQAFAAAAGALLGDDVGAGLGEAVGVDPADDGALGDRRVLVEDLLDLARVDLRSRRGGTCPSCGRR